MRRRLTTLALVGTKVATAGLWQQDYVDQGEAIEVVGERQALLNDDGNVAAIIEMTRVETYSLFDVPWEFAQAEGEGFESIDHWRDGHRGYYARQGVEITAVTAYRSPEIAHAFSMCRPRAARKSA